MTKKSVLFVFTSASELNPGEAGAKPKATGWFLPEAAHPYYVLREHVLIDFASPKGPNPPLDQSSVDSHKEDAQSVKFLNDEEVESKLATAKSLKQVDVNDYDAVFYVGGHGPMIDLREDPDNAALATQFHRAGKIVAAVCHGPIALSNVKDVNGASIFKGRKVTGFSNDEDTAMGYTEKEIGKFLQTRIGELGGTYEKAGEDFGENVVVDGKLITGQNPNSAKGVGEAILKALRV